MYHVSAQGIDERMINVHYYYYAVEERRLWQLDIKRQARKEAKTNPAAAVACPVCGRICASELGLQSHQRRHWRRRRFVTDNYDGGVCVCMCVSPFFLKYMCVFKYWCQANIVNNIANVN